MKGKKGITLVALIITIVVLLILAVVAIAVIANDGILDYAANSTKEYNAAVENEANTLNEYTNYLGNHSEDYLTEEGE